MSFSATLIAMKRSFLIVLPSAFALAACLTVSWSASAAPTHARVADPSIDARILSAAPFEFRADRGIFSAQPGTPADSRIFKPRQPMPRAYEMRISDESFEVLTHL